MPNCDGSVFFHFLLFGISLFLQLLKLNRSKSTPDLSELEYVYHVVVASCCFGDAVAAFPFAAHPHAQHACVFTADSQRQILSILDPVHKVESLAPLHGLQGQHRNHPTSSHQVLPLSSSYWN